MKDFRFTLSGPDFTAFTIDEPQGWSELTQSVLRDTDSHGILFQATINSLTFYGIAAQFLMDQKELKGLKAEVNFLAEERCKPADPYEEALTGRLNFGRFESVCGLTCTVTMPVEEEGCKMTFKNRLDQAVDFDTLVGFDKITGLSSYAGLGMTITLAAQDLDVGVVGDVGPDGDHFSEVDIPSVQSGISVRPIYIHKERESINLGQLEPTNRYGTYRPSFKSPTSPVLLLDENFDCFPGKFSVDIRLKGSYAFVQGLLNEVWIRIVESADNTVIPDPDNVILAETKRIVAAPGPISGTFDLSYVNPATTLRNGYGIYTEVLFITSPFTADPDVDVDFDPETHFSVLATRSCPPTDAKVYLINESLSRMAEAISNNCIKVKSDYYGRTDSQPYASTNDGCGSLRVLTNGLQLRQQPNSKMFLSMEDALKDLKAIDNIGWGFEPNTALPGYDVLRIEPVEYWYQDVEVLRCPYIPQVTSSIEEKAHYSVVKVGYNKWEPKAVGGLYEFNSVKEFRTSLETVKNTLDITSNFIAAGTVIEGTRQQSFVSSGEADTTYDNDTFIICVEREAYGYKVEQGHIVGDANIFSPGTVYNWRLRPMYNLMRWFKSIANSYANILDSASKLFFTSGTGNYIATGQLVDDCALENAPISENKDLAITDFKNQTAATPLFRNESVIFTYPVSASDFSKVKANPRGFISYQCGTGAWLKGYIMEANWSPAEGKAEFKLKLKWNYT